MHIQICQLSPQHFLYTFAPNFTMPKTATAGLTLIRIHIMHSVMDYAKHCSVTSAAR